MRIYIGWDSREQKAYEVCEYTLLKNSEGLDIRPIILSDLRKSGTYIREEDPYSSTEFTFSRFLVPYLNGYRGWALFCDCDFLWLSDVKDLLDFADEDKAVMVVQHDYKPTSKYKMDGRVQFQYPRKNWSSLILWNCGHPSNLVLTDEMVNKSSGQFLHRFEWLDDEHIGKLPHCWNWLVGWYKEPEDGYPKALHYTEGGPWFNDYKNCEYAEEWLKTYSNLKNSL